MKIWGEKNSTKQNRQNTSQTKQKLNQINRNCRVPWRAAKEREFQQRMLCHQLRKDEAASLPLLLERGWCSKKGQRSYFRHRIWLEPSPGARGQATVSAVVYLQHLKRIKSTRLRHTRSWRPLAVLAEDLDLFPRTHTAVTTACNSSSRGAYALFWPLHAL